MLMKLKYQVTTLAHIDYETSLPNVKPVLRATDVNLELSKNLDRKAFFNAKGMPNMDGTKAITNVLVSGLANNIHQAHQNGLWDSAEHLRYIIAELERQFVQVADAKPEVFNPLNT